MIVVSAKIFAFCCEIEASNKADNLKPNVEITSKLILIAFLAKPVISKKGLLLVFENEFIPAF